MARRMRSLLIVLLLTFTACVSEPSSESRLLGAEEYWYIVDWPLTKTHHTSESCPTQDLGEVTYTVEYPFAQWPLVPAIVNEPAWLCDNIVNGEINCEYLLDEDLPIIWMGVRDDEVEQYVEIWWPGCHYVFEPG